MRFLLIVLGVLLSSGIGLAELHNLLSYQKQGDSGAYISSGFHDWRTVSKYRRHPGLHAGYDIAMYAGTPVRAAWPGRVVKIIPWYGSEYGVTVLLANGYEVTYGHIHPLVNLGHQVERGDVLGTVVVDHVDVKMRDTKGAYVDFARLNFPNAMGAGAVKSVPDSKELEKTRKEHQRLRDDFEKKKRALALGLIAENDLKKAMKSLHKLENRLGLPLTGEATVSKERPEEPENPRAVSDFLVNSSYPADF